MAQEEAAATGKAWSAAAPGSRLQTPPRSTWPSIRKRLVPSVACVILLCAVSMLYSPARPRESTAWSSWHSHSQPASQRQFFWSEVAPARSLEYVPCYGSFQCARLSVPLNWNASADEQENGPRAAIAIVKLPAKVPVTDPRYGGVVLVNPGGPGESGVYQVLTDGENLQVILDVDDDDDDDETLAERDGKFFDVLSFDPRGVNNTTPRLSCFSDPFDQQSWLLGLPDYGLLWHSESIIGMEWARAEALGASCSAEQGEAGILRYANTAQTAQDMLHIVEQHGEWRANEAKRLLEHPGCGKPAPQPEPAVAIMERTAYRPGQERLQYWGMSYGTLLGATFAAMHPDRVGRVVLDGVVDPADHYAGQYLTQLQDSDTIISKFCEYCFTAGPLKCALHTGTSPQDVELRLTKILVRLKTEPIAMPPAAAHPGPALITYGDAHLALLSAMYFPFATAEFFFDLLVSLEGRNTSDPALAQVVATKRAALGKAGCGAEPGAPVPYVSAFGAFQAISCLDAAGGGAPGEPETRAGFRAYLAELEAQGRWISPSWARNRLACVGFGTATAPAWRLGFDFARRAWEPPAHPLLVVSNTHDTVTPLRNAQRVAGLFPGSAVLRQDSQGHCSHSNPSLCTARAVRRYFQTGELPAGGEAVCEPATRPFLGCTAAGSKSDDGECQFEHRGEARLWRAMVELADPFGLRPKEEGVDGLIRMGLKATFAQQPL